MATFTPADSSALHAALAAASGGDEIQLTAGVTYTGNFVLPVHAGGSDVLIYTNTTLPAPGAWVTPGAAVNFAKLQSPDNQPALATAASAEHWHIYGVEFLPCANPQYSIIAFGDGDRSVQTSLALTPRYLTLDRCYVHGDATNGQLRGLALNSRDATIVDCYFSDLKWLGSDSQAIGGWNGPGPFTIQNNYLEAAGYSVIFGGSDSAIADLMPSDLTFTDNYCTKQTAWRSQGWQVKNIFELKTMSGATITDNTFENCWADAQNGIAILFTVRNQDGNAPWSTIENVVFQRNTVRHAAGVFNILGEDNLHTSGTLTNLQILDNVCYDISAATYGGSGRFMLLNGGDQITVNHNTAPDNDGEVSVYFTDTQTTSLVWTNNIGVSNGRYFGADSGLNGSGALSAWAPGATATYNAIIQGSATGYPSGNFYPASVAAVDFVDVAGGDYELETSSPYHNAASDGADIGARFSSTPGSVTGTGAVTIAAPGFSGTGVVTPASGGAIGSGGIAIAAPGFAGTGTVTTPTPVPSGGVIQDIQYTEGWSDENHTVTFDGAEASDLVVVCLGYAWGPFLRVDASMGGYWVASIEDPQATGTWSLIGVHDDNAGTSTGVAMGQYVVPSTGSLTLTVNTTGIMGNSGVCASFWLLRGVAPFDSVVTGHHGESGEAVPTIGPGAVASANTFFLATMVENLPTIDGNATSPSGWNALQYGMTSELLDRTRGYAYLPFVTTASVYSQYRISGEEQTATWEDAVPVGSWAGILASFEATIADEPLITSITSIECVSLDEQTMTITGINFPVNASVTVTDGTGSEVDITITSQNSTTIVLTGVFVGGGPYTVTVAQANGGTPLDSMAVRCFVDYITRRERIFNLPFNENRTIFLNRLEFLIEAGQGTASGQGRHPQVMVQLSRDGGFTWGPEFWLAAGAQGEYRQRLFRHRLGRYRQAVCKVVVTDPIRWNLLECFGEWTVGTS